MSASFALRALTVTAVGALSAGLLTALPGAAHADTVAHDGHVTHGKVVGTDSAGWTPHIQDGSVRAITEVGDVVVAGGDFTTVRQTANSPALARPGLVMFRQGTGSIVDAPTVVDGRVEAVLPGATPGTVWVGGAIKSLNGQNGKLFLVDVNTGSVLRRVPLDGAVYDLAMARGQLLVGGTFTSVNGNPRKGLASVDPTTGAVTTFLQVATDGHHNYNGVSGANAAVGPKSFDVSPDESRLVVVGNFRTLDGQTRRQIGMIDLTGNQAVVDANWATSRYSDACATGAFDSWVRTVAFEPSGQYFAVSTTGGPFSGTLCDTAVRWNATEQGANLQPHWIASSGGDTLNGLTVTDSAVYVGGHQRWMNNVDGADKAAPGGMARPGIASLEPQSGVPNAWNPGRHPRGVNTYVMYSSPSGMWIGSDQDYLGYYEVKRPKIAFFPLQGGETPAKGDSGKLPGVLSALNTDGTFKAIASDGASFTDTNTTVPGLDATKTRGATLIDGTLYYGSTDGTLYKRSFTNDELGTASAINPYHDPKWDTLKTGSGTSVYKGVLPEIYGQFGTVNGLEYSDGQMYYTRSGDNRLFRSGFSLSSGALEPFTGTSNGKILTGTLDRPGEFVISDGSIYYARTSDGSLLKAPLTRDAVGASTVVSGPGVDGINWNTRALVLRHTPPPPPNQDPTAAFTATPSDLSVSLDASGSTDADGTVSDYSWDFGDGATGNGVTADHTYDAAGTYQVTLTVTDNQGGTQSLTKDVTVVAPPEAEFVGQTGYNGNAKTVTLNLPAAAQPGDTVVLTRGINSVVPSTGPTGTGAWRSLGKAGSAMEAEAFVATVTNAGQSITLSTDTFVKWDVRVAVYRGVDADGATAQWADGGSATTRSTPDVTATSSQFLALSYWTAKSATTVAWGTPSRGELRTTGTGTGSGQMAGALADRTVGATIGDPVNGSEIAFGTSVSRFAVATILLPASE